MFEFVKRWFRNSAHVHVVQQAPRTFSELVSLFDRFLDGPLAYPLEWDDFISWPSKNPNIEAVRDRLGQFERLLFSRDINDKAEYRRLVVEERNIAAALIGMAPRQ